MAKKRKIFLSKEQVLVKAFFHEQGSVLKGDAEGFCDSFEISILVEADVEESKLRDLLYLARKMCFTAKALVGETPITVTEYINPKTYSF